MLRGPVQALTNSLLCFLCLVPGVIHAILVVRDHRAEESLRNMTIKKTFAPPDWYVEPEKERGSSENAVLIALAATILIAAILAVI